MPVRVLINGRYEIVPVRVLQADLTTWKLVSGAGFLSYDGPDTSPVTDPKEVDSNGEYKGLREAVVIQAKPRLYSRYLRNAPSLNLVLPGATIERWTSATVGDWRTTMLHPSGKVYVGMLCFDAAKLTAAIGDRTVKYAELRFTKGPDATYEVYWQSVLFPSAIGSEFPDSSLTVSAVTGAPRQQVSREVIRIPSGSLAGFLSCIQDTRGALALFVVKNFKKAIDIALGGNDTSSSKGVMILTLYCTLD